MSLNLLADKVKEIDQRVSGLEGLDSPKMSFTAGSVLFASANGGLTSDPGQLHWDATNNRLAIGSNAPAAPLDIVAAASAYNSEVGAIRIALAGATAKRLYMGWDTTINGGYLQAVENGVTYRTLALNPSGASVVVGGLTATRQFTINEPTNPQLSLNKAGSERWVIGAEGGASDRLIIYTQGGTLYAAIFNYGNGYLGLQNTVPTYALELPNIGGTQGQGRANAWVTYSSEVYKRDIRALSKYDAIERVRGLQASYFKLVGSDITQLGLIAEQARPFIPELITDAGEGPKGLGLSYDRLAVLLLPVIQGLLEDVERLKLNAIFTR